MAVEIKTLVERIEAAGAAALRSLEACADVDALELARVRLLGKKGELRRLAELLKEAPPERRPDIGQALNEVRVAVERALEARLADARAEALQRRLRQEDLDVTLPGRPGLHGHLHPLTLVQRRMEAIFTSLGFEIATGPDTETEELNFDALNIPLDHPARDMHDTFYLVGGGLLRTHTSPVQIRALRRLNPPLAIIAPGRVYRYEAADDTHSPVFHQIEALLVDRQVRMSDLKGVLALFLRRMFGPETRYRFRPSYFPFTEPSAEVDIFWQLPGREPAWMEILGAGMVHPKVLAAGGADPTRWTGFALGVGVERVAMLTYGIPSMRLFYQNDVRFLRQF